MLYDGTDGQAVGHLSSIAHVTLQFLAPPFASARDIERFAVWQARHWQWGGKPGNFQLMVKQGAYVWLSISLQLLGIFGMTWAVWSGCSLRALCGAVLTHLLWRQHQLKVSYCAPCESGWGMEEGLRLARHHRQEWLLHIDPDEIVLPMTGAFSLATGGER